MTRMLLILPLLLIGATVMPAWADAPSRIFVASTGSDSNDGTRATPMRTFQAAHDAVAVGGDIVVLDSAGYGRLSITKSVSLAVPPGVSAFINSGKSDAPEGVGITVDAPNSSISIRGVTLTGNTGISTVNYGLLNIESCTFQNSGLGIVGGSTQSRASLVVRGSTFRGGYSAMQLIERQPNSILNVTISDVSIVQTGSALLVRNTSAGAAIKAVVSRANITNSSIAIAISTEASGTNEVVVDNSILSHGMIAFSVTYSSSGSSAQGTYAPSSIFSRGNNVVYDFQQPSSPTAIFAGQ